MKKKSHEHFIDYLTDNLPRLQSEYAERQRETDKVVMWLTALSAGAIALIISNSNNLAISNPIYLKSSVLFFILGIISGVVFRAHVYFLEQIQSELISNFMSYCYGYTVEHNGPIEIKDYHTIQDIAGSLKNDMGLDYDYWLTRDYLDRDFWVEHYQRRANHWETEDKRGLKMLGRQFASLLHKKPNETEKIFIEPEQDNSLPKKSKILTYICKISYVLLMLFFGLGMLSIAFGYLCK